MNMLVDFDQIISNATQAYNDYHVQQKIKNALVGKFLMEEIAKLPADADSWAFYKAKERARERARVFAEIAMSAKNAQLLIQELSGFIQEAKEFLNK